MSSQRRLNAIISNNVNGVHIEGVEGVRNTIFQHFQSHFIEVMLSRSGVGDLSFKTISMENGANLIRPFVLKEIKA